MERHFSLWLCPEAEVRPVLANLINCLAARFGTPAFEPHLTLFAGVSSESQFDRFAEAALSVLRTPVLLRCSGLAHTPALFKTLFVTFEKEPALSKAAEAIADALKPEHPYTLMPHLSLLYKEALPQEVRLELVQHAPPLPTTITFSELGVVSPPSGAGWEAIGDWEVLRRYPL